MHGPTLFEEPVVDMALVGPMDGFAAEEAAGHGKGDLQGGVGREKDQDQHLVIKRLSGLLMVLVSKEQGSGLTEAQEAGGQQHAQTTRTRITQIDAGGFPVEKEETDEDANDGHGDARLEAVAQVACGGGDQKKTGGGHGSGQAVGSVHHVDGVNDG